MKREELFCAYCTEPILDGDALAPILGALQHWACGFRQFIGGVNHIEGRCTCCGGTEPPDPPGLTPREAALAAVEAWERKRAAR